jgi:hypothetical protein
MVFSCKGSSREDAHNCALRYPARAGTTLPSEQVAPTQGAGASEPPGTDHGKTPKHGLEQSLPTPATDQGTPCGNNSK